MCVLPISAATGCAVKTCSLTGIRTGIEALLHANAVAAAGGGHVQRLSLCHRKLWGRLRGVSGRCWAAG